MTKRDLLKLARAYHDIAQVYYENHWKREWEIAERAANHFAKKAEETEE